MDITLLTPKNNSSSSLPECPPTPKGFERPTLLLLRHQSFPVLPFQFDALGEDTQSTQSRRVSEVTNTSAVSSLFKSIESKEKVSKDEDSIRLVKEFGWSRQHYAQIKGLQVPKMVQPKAA